MEQILEKLFESGPKVRILRLFVRNPERFFEFSEILKLSQTKSSQARSELSKLIKIGLVKEKFASVREEIKLQAGSKKKTAKLKIRHAKVYFVNKDFSLINELSNLVSKAAVASKTKLASQLKQLGKVKLAVTSGIFLNEDNSRTDLLIVGENIKPGKLEKFLTQTESELGKSIQYTLMNTEEFKYRMHMYDRFLRDILENEHEKLIDKVHV